MEATGLRHRLGRSWERLFWALCLLVMCLQAPAEQAERLTLASLGSSDQIQHKRESRFDVEYFAANQGWVGEVIARADAARRIVNGEVPDALLVTIHIVLAPDRKSFMRLVGNWAENSAAVAVPDTIQVVINGDALRAGSVGTLGTTLVHELTHIYIGVRCQRPLPRWLNEGLAMSVAGEWSLEDTASVVLASKLGRLIPLSELERTFPVQADKQRLAYLESHSVVNYLARQTPENSVLGVLRPIIGKEGRSQIELYWSASYRDKIESQWRQTLRSRWNWTLISLSSGLFWGIVALLTFVAWLVRRHRSKAMHKEWDEEERIYEALDEEERRIWGDDDEEEQDEEHDRRY